MRKWLTITGLAVLFFMILTLFWYNEWKYSLPTPLPSMYRPTSKGTYISLTGKFSFPENEPVLLHFFNPDCPCSRFNMVHFKSLVAAYGNKINFAVVVVTKDKNCTKETIRQKYDLTVPVLLDTALAAACGVYSTPQAVLLNTAHQLYYRGNYNRNRYCADNKTSYARIAIDSLLLDQPSPEFNKYALTAYGCTLPECKK